MPGAEIFLQLIHTDGVGVGARSNSQHRLERALEMERALVKLACQLLPRHRFVEMTFDVAAHRFDHVGLCIAKGFRPAAQAGPVAGFLSIFRLREEGNILLARTAGWTGRPAVHSGRRNGEYKFAVLRGVAFHDRLPLLSVVVSRHIYRFCKVEYRIGCHGHKVAPGESVDYPDLAVKAKNLEEIALFSWGGKSVCPHRNIVFPKPQRHLR